MNELKFLFGVLVVLGIFLVIACFFLVVSMHNELEGLTSDTKEVNLAFDLVNVEISVQLKHNKALHISELLNIIKTIGKTIPSVDITLDKTYGNDRLDLVIKKGNVVAKYSLITTVIEYGKPRLKETL